MGLKAYDLVWLEGKSAAWRYPCELEELKAFAPAVEEQPFDRFYRKSTPAATTAAATTTAAAMTTKAPPAETPIPVTVESTKAPGKRIIYVTMPAARNTSVATPQPVLSRAEPVRETIQPVMTPALEDNAQRIQPARDRVIEDYSAHQIEDEVMTEEFFPRKKRSPRLIRLLTIAICILALLAAGIIIGLNLNKETLGFPLRVIAKVPADQAIVHPTAQQLPAPAITAPASTTDSSRSADPGRVADPASTTVAQPNAVPAPAAKTTTRIPGAKTSKERSAHSMSRPNSLMPAKDSANESLVANAVHRADVAEPYHSNTEIADKEAVKAALASLVSVGANGYSVGTFGGITDLQLTVTNRSVYPLDLVIVEVRYIQANKKIFKTEDLYFHSIGAGSALMQEAPKSSRGVRVQYKILSITSKEVAYSYSGI